MRHNRKMVVALAFVILCGCAKRPEVPLESVTMNGKDNRAEASPAAQIAEVSDTHLSAQFTDLNQKVQAMEAALHGFDTEIILQGRIRDKEIIPEQLQSAFPGSAATADGEIRTEDGYISYNEIGFPEDAAVEGGIIKADFPQSVTECIRQLNEALGTHQIIETVTTMRTGKGEAFYEYNGSVGIGGVSLIEKLYANQLEYGGSGRISAADGRWIALELKDFEIVQRSAANIMTAEELASCLGELLRNGQVKPVESGQPITAMDLCYMTERQGDEFDIVPVCVFSVPYVMEEYKVFEADWATRYVVLDARDGSLIEYNGAF